MSDWTPSVDDPQYIAKTIKRGAVTVTISRPVLSDEERARREVNARTALEGVMRQYLHRRKTK